MLKHLKHVAIGIFGGLALLIFYFVFLTAANSFSHAIEQFSQMWYWILILVTGFGIQVGFYSCIRAARGAVAVSGSVSTGAMVICCLHHLVDVLPVLGLAAVSLFLIQYQVNFIILGILSNIVGIIIMLEIIQKHQLSQGFFKRVLIYDMGRIKKIAIGLSLILFLTTFFLVNNQTKKEIINLPIKTDDSGGITFEVKPVNFALDTQVKFEIKIDTHSGSLDFDLTKISILEDDKGNKYLPLEWQGTAPGGHHGSGTILFPKLNTQANKIKLTIQDVPPRIFEWDLK